MENRPEGVNESTTVVSTVPADSKEPTLPKGINEVEEQDLKDRALTLVTELAEADGGREMELTDGITSLGVQAQLCCSDTCGWESPQSWGTYRKVFRPSPKPPA